MLTAAQSGGTKRAKQITEVGPFHFVVPFWFRGLIIAAIVSLFGGRSGQTCRQPGIVEPVLRFSSSVMRAVKSTARNICRRRLTLAVRMSLDERCDADAASDKPPLLNRVGPIYPSMAVGATAASSRRHPDQRQQGRARKGCRGRPKP